MRGRHSNEWITRSLKWLLLPLSIISEQLLASVINDDDATVLSNAMNHLWYPWIFFSFEL